MAIRKEKKSSELSKELFSDPEETRSKSLKAEEPTLDSTSGGIGVGTRTASSLSFEKSTKLLKEAISRR